MKRNAEVNIIDSQPEKVSKHTLESDEELDEDEKGGRLAEEELRAVGQEAETISFDEGVQITPFNMKEELEDDGHFDASGNFIFKKVNENGDNWLDDVDWKEVRQREEAGEQPKENIEAVNEALPDITSDQRTNLYREACALMQPRETVLRALKRMGPKQSSGQQRRNWTRRKDGTVKNATKESDADSDPNAMGFSRLTELANDIMGSGDYDIYQKTKEILEDLVASSEKKTEFNELDALGAEIDEEAGIEEAEADENDDAPKWILKKGPGPDADAEVEGPYPEVDVRRWLEQGIFRQPDKVWVKRQGSNDAFVSLSSIKFDSKA